MSTVEAEDTNGGAGALAIMAAAADEIEAKDAEQLTVPPALSATASGASTAAVSATTVPTCSMAMLGSLPMEFIFGTEPICSAMYAFVRRGLDRRLSTKSCAGMKYNVAADDCAESLLRTTCAAATAAHVEAD